MSLYIRVKRSSQTIFLHVEPTETFQEVKDKVRAILYQDATEGDNTGTEALQLCKDENLTEELPGMATLMDHNIQDDACIYLTVGGKF